MVFEFLRPSNDQKENIIESTIKKMSPEKEKLLKLEATGEFVFHGSPNDKIEVLEPRQPLIGAKSEKHGSPRVAATDSVETAIFRAIVNGSNFPDKKDASGFGMRGGKLYFEVSPSASEKLDNSKEGYVYVMPKSGFEELSTIELALYEPIQPVEVIRVTSKDLPEGIMVMKR